jgi:hypothetical protein
MSAEFERYTHRPRRIVLVRHRYPKQSHEALTHHRMEPPSILVHYVLGKRLELQEQAMQGIEIKTRA